jgi:diacylglycerol kinase (ATP)
MGNAFKGQSGLKRIVRAVGYSVQGLRSAYTHENAFRQEVWAAFVMLPASIWLGRSATEILLLAGSVCLVMIRISFDVHELSKRAKDQASAAVFLSVLLCLAVWSTVIWLRFVI